MLHGRRIVAFLFVAVLALPFVSLELYGQAKDDKDKKDTAKDPTKVTLAWKFEKGKTFYQTMKTTTNQTMKVMNNDVTQKQDQTFFFSWTVTEVNDKENTAVLEQKILGVKMDIDIGGSPIHYDSTSAAANNASNPLSEFFKALVNSSFKVTLDTKTLKVKGIEGRKDFVGRLVTANKQMQPLLEKILSDDALKEMAEPTFAVVTNDAVEKGGKPWSKETTLDMGPIGKYVNKYTYTYEGQDDKKLDKISVKTQLTYTPPDKTEGVGGLPFRIKTADLKSKNASGTIYFDRDKGRVIKTEMSLELGGKLEIEIGGQGTTVELTQTQKTDVSTSVTNPVEPAKTTTK
jgi:hypothetical protein